MDLAGFQEKYPSLEGYKEQDQESLFDLFDRTPMDLQGLKLIYDRRPYFSSLLKAQSNQWLTILSKREGRSLGFASMSVSPRYFNGKLQNVCYLGDLRTELDSKTLRLWRKSYGDVLELCKGHFSSAPPKKFLTAILKNNQVAKRSLVHSKRKNPVTYDFLKTVQMVNVLGAYMPFKKPDSVRWATKDDRKKIQKFLQNTHEQMQLGYDFSIKDASEWKNREKNWPNWSIEKFLLKEVDGQIVGLCMPWSPTQLKRMRITDCDWKLKTLFSLAKLFGCKNPKVGENFSTLYLTHMSFDRNSSFNEINLGYEFSRFLFKEGALKKYNLISFCSQTPQKSRAGLLTQTTDVDLYFVRPSHEQKSEPINDYIDFEMTLV